ncbi:hypothetical protein [Vibrio gallaecicus]|nr:hypothetical protein [Vibrio gallaecicus]MDN3614234.1 hypothetical protein [Vibrio gallaecicus]
MKSSGSQNHSKKKTSNKKKKKSLVRAWVEVMLWLMPVTVGVLTAYALSK